MRWWRFAISNRRCQKLAFCSAWRNVDPNGRCRKRLVKRYGEQVNLLVVEPGENAALCLLAQPGVVIQQAEPCSLAMRLQNYERYRLNRRFTVTVSALNKRFNFPVVTRSLWHAAAQNRTIVTYTIFSADLLPSSKTYPAANYMSAWQE